MLRALLLLVATPAFAARAQSPDGLPMIVSTILPLLVAGAGLWLARRALRARFRRAPKD